MINSQVSDERLSEISEVVAQVVRRGDCRIYHSDHREQFTFKADTLLSILIELQHLRSQSLSTQQPMGE